VHEPGRNGARGEGRVAGPTSRVSPPSLAPGGGAAHPSIYTTAPDRAPFLSPSAPGHFTSLRFTSPFLSPSSPTSTPSSLSNASPTPAPNPSATTTNRATRAPNGGAPRVVGRGGRPGCVRSRGMGKDAGEALPDGAGGGGRGGSCCCGAGRPVRLQCVAALALGVAVLLSALFWLPPFARPGGGAEGPDPGGELGGECCRPLRDLGSCVCACGEPMSSLCFPGLGLLWTWLHTPNTAHFEAGNLRFSSYHEPGQDAVTCVRI
jgi:hypothetical protein